MSQKVIINIGHTEPLPDKERCEKVSKHIRYMQKQYREVRTIQVNYYELSTRAEFYVNR